MTQSPFRERLLGDLEPVLSLPDPRPKLGASHDIPCAIFLYKPAEEYELRKELGLLTTRLRQKNKRVTVISLAECLDEALRSQRPLEEWFAAEREHGVETIIDTIHAVLSNDDYAPLVELVAKRIPKDASMTDDVVLITRTGAVFPFYRTSALLEQLERRVIAPAVLFYSGGLEGPSGLRFMDVLEAEHNYRPRIF